MCQSKFSNSFATSVVSSFTKPTNPIYLSTATDSLTSSSFTQSTYLTRFSMRASPTPSSSIKARTENFEKLETMDEMDWEAIKARTNIHEADNFPQDIAIDMNLEKKADDLMDVIAKFGKMELVDDMDWKPL